MGTVVSQKIWRYKIAIYSTNGIAASIGLLHYLNYRIGVEKPLYKSVTDRHTGKAVAMYYFAEADNAYAMWEVLKFVGQKWNHDSYLTHYDWDEAKMTQLEEQHHHRHEE